MTELTEEFTGTLAGRVWQTVLKYPGNPALELDDRLYTYNELYNTAASISQSILELDDQGPYVAIMADKSFSCFAGILGILLAGKAYLPLNPRFPASRNLYMLEKARARVVVAGENSDDELEQILDDHTEEIFIIFPEEVDMSPKGQIVPKIVGAGDPAYLLFTSGTTGKPKGVPVSNGNVLSYLSHMQQSFDFRPDDRFTQIFDLTFDLSVHDIFLAWTSGACLCVPEENSSFAMARFIREKQPTVWFSVPSVVLLMEKMRLLKPGAFPSIRLSFFCGEALYSHTAKAWKKAVPHSRIINLYGPTEATIAISQYELPDNPEQWKTELGIISIGKVFEGNNYTILKQSTETLNGELCLIGNQVVEGYFENEEADRDAYWTEPVSLKKYYKTGDLVRIDGEGDLYFAGRKDAEVKISGYRVNLKEIENVISEHESVEQAVVIYEKADEQGLIMAFILLFDKEKTLEKDLDAFCRQKLPWYMVPGKFIFVEEIPLNVNGKVDVTSLKTKYIHGT